MQEIDYTFDAVNNIVDITNNAGVLNNGLGGDYRHSYNYDNSYRLISSNGLWDNNNNSLNYQLALTYTMDGRILTKTQYATTLIGGALSNFSYDNHYTYYDNQPHTVKKVLDVQNQVNQDFAWDANGNFTLHEHELNGTQRRLCWDEENRLMAVGDNNYTSYYQYDNAGERIYKLTGLNTMMNINGRWVNFATMDNPTLYTSAYLVAGVQGYTKHYYAGSERVSSAIGLGGLGNINNPLPIEFGGSWDEKSGSLMEEMNRTIVECLKNEYKIEASLKFLHDMKEAVAGTMDRYFYHPDHLGSSSVSTPLNNHWITDGSGNAIQHLHYLPFGEDWVDQRNASWSAPYTFSGKEKDVETGYSYFGARYYDSGLSVWLSVDPMSDKYPNLTPYNYCANNPVILVDPDGREVEYNSNIDIIIVAAFRLVNSKFDSYVKTLENSDELYTFNYNEDGKNSFGYDGRSLIISYSLTDALSEEGATINSLLMHETEHAMQFEHGEIGFSRNDLNGNPLPDGGWRPIGYDLTDEWKAHDAEFRSIQDFNGPRNVTNLWGKKERESFRSNPVMTKWDQLIYLKLNERYFDLPLGPINAPKNLNETVKNNQTYIKPYKQR